MSADDAALFERLRRLRRELAAPRGAQLPVEAAPGTGIPQWLRARLSLNKGGERAPPPAAEGGLLAPPASPVVSMSRKTARPRSTCAREPSRA